MSHRILVVDDCPDVLQGLERAMRGHPYELDCRTSAQDAIEAMGEREYDVLIADERMPGMTGTDLLAWSHRYYPSTRRIMLTGLDKLETAQEAVNRGQVFRFLTKPCRGVDVAFAIFEAIEDRRSDLSHTE